MDPLPLASNSATAPLVNSYTEVLDGRIPDECMSNLGFASKQELVTAYFVDSVRGTFRQELDEQGLAEAFDRGEFLAASLCYRSIDDIDGPPVGGEFLARRFVPERGLSGAGDWYKAIESAGRAPELDQIALENGAMVAARLDGFASSSNVSGDFLRSGSLPRIVEDTLSKSNANPNNMHLEILENISTLTDTDLSTIRRLVAMGVRICVDDCGALEAGNYLENLVRNGISVHTLKIDGAETASVLESPERVIGWGKKAEEIGAQEIVFEGSFPIVLTPKLINLLCEARDAINGRVPWYVEGPIFPDKE